MTCHEFVDFFMEYFSEALSQDEQMECERHLVKCPDCAAYLHGYRETITLGKAVFAYPEATVPQGVPEELVQAILAGRQRET